MNILPNKKVKIKTDRKLSDIKPSKSFKDKYENAKKLLEESDLSIILKKS